MQEVVPGVWIGDYEACQNEALLAANGIGSVIAAIKYEYASTRHILRLPLEDTNGTNIIQHFSRSNEFIRDALDRDDSVLVHCQAGISRSTTLVAAFLMADEGLTVEEAIETIKRVRGQVEPNEFFLHQLEMYERCDCEWDPVKWNEQRRFLMNFAQAQIMDGVAPSIILAYYPSPSPSPSPSPRGEPSAESLKMTPLDADSVSSSLERRRRGSSTSEHETPVASVPMRKRLTTRSPMPATPPPSAKPVTPKATVENIGKKGEVVVVGKRIRCRLSASLPLGSTSFCTKWELVNKRSHRIGATWRPIAREQEKRRLDELDREQQKVVGPPRPSQASSSIDAAASGIEGLRIAMPSGPIPGLRIAQPRPRTPLPTASSSVDTPETVSKTDDETVEPLQDGDVKDESPLQSTPPPEPLPEEPLQSPEPPLLPSHLCSSYFVEPLSWMSPTLETGVLAGRLSCPNKRCGAKLGSYDWAGLQCSCGAWVCPGFALNVSRVDEFKPLS